MPKLVLKVFLPYVTKHGRDLNAVLGSLVATQREFLENLRPLVAAYNLLLLVSADHVHAIVGMRA